MANGKKQVLYLLGAGASCFSVPILDHWSSSLRDFREYLEIMVKTLPINESISLQDRKRFQVPLEDALSEVSWLVNESHGQYTIDTFAKNLFIRKKDNELARLKRVVTLFLFYCQTQEKYLLNHGNGTFDTKSRTVRDPRYETWFAFLLNRGATALPENIKIVSWNYDSQLEIAFREFVPNEQIVFESITTNTKQILRMNGVAGSKMEKSSTNQSFLKVFSWLFHQNYSPEQLVAAVHDSHIALEGNELGIRYAWESDAGKGAVAKLEDMNLEIVDAVVAIGYSFPFFNRDIDRMILSKLDPQKVTWYFQYPEGQHESIVEKVSGFEIYGLQLSRERFLSGRDANVVFVEDTRTFYVPYGA